MWSVTLIFVFEFATKRVNHDEGMIAFAGERHVLHLDGVFRRILIGSE